MGSGVEGDQEQLPPLTTVPQTLEALNTRVHLAGVRVDTLKDNLRDSFASARVNTLKDNQHDSFASARVNTPKDNQHDNTTRYDSSRGYLNTITHTQAAQWNDITRLRVSPHRYAHKTVRSPKSGGGSSTDKFPRITDRCRNRAKTATNLTDLLTRQSTTIAQSQPAICMMLHAYTRVEPQHCMGYTWSEVLPLVHTARRLQLRDGPNTLSTSPTRTLELPSARDASADSRRWSHTSDVAKEATSASRNHTTLVVKLPAIVNKLL